MENEREEQQFEEGSPQAESGEVEAGNAETSYAGPVAGSTGDWEETEVPVADGTDDAGYGERPEPSPAEQFADSARTQAGAAANAMRRGEFMHSAAVDISADGDDRLIALLCYVTQALIPLIMPILVLLSASSKKRPFQRFHAVQSLALFLTFILFGLLMVVGSTILALGANHRLAGCDCRLLSQPVAGVDGLHGPGLLWVSGLSGQTVRDPRANELSAGSGLDLAVLRNGKKEENPLFCPQFTTHLSH